MGLNLLIHYTNTFAIVAQFTVHNSTVDKMYLKKLLFLLHTKGYTLEDATSQNPAIDLSLKKAG
jgi:hypothetical protein